MADAPISFIAHGASIQTFKVKGVNIVQSFDTPEQYKSHNSPFFGETVGRVANRLAGAELRSLNGRTYALDANNGPNSLHGGPVGWGKRDWEGPRPVGLREIPGVEGLRGGESVEFRLRSEDGDQGFPGAVEARIVYTTGTQTDGEGREVLVLGMDYEAELVGGDGVEETAVNMTNHSYFNLSGDMGGTVAGTTVTLPTDKHLPVDDVAIPTGGPAPFRFDTSKPFVLGPAEPDVDHCFTLADDPSSVPVDTRARPLRLNLSARHEGTGIHLEVLSTEPAFQFYTGGFIDVPAVGGLPARVKRGGFCCEPGRWVNAPNVEAWRGMTTLRKGDKYGARIVYRAWAN